MPVPPVTDPCWLRLARGDLRYLRTGHRATELMIERLSRSSEPATRKATELYSYFAKWGADLPFELGQIRQL